MPPPYTLDYTVSHFDPEYTSMKLSWSEGDDIHDGEYRSQSVVDFPCEISLDSASNSNEADTTVIVANPEKLESGSKPKPKSKPKLKKKLKRGGPQFDFGGLQPKNWKANLELFLGYPYSHEFKPVVAHKSVAVPLKHNKKAAAATEAAAVAVTPMQGCTLLNKSPAKDGSSTAQKTFSIQAASLMGESNDQDILITDSDQDEEEDSENDVSGENSSLHKPANRSREKVVAMEKIQTRCASTENLRKPVTKYIPQVRAKKAVPYVRKQLAKVKVKPDPYETCKLLMKPGQSKITAGIIKLNDDINGVISERKRKASPDKMLKVLPHKAKISLNPPLIRPKASSSKISAIKPVPIHSSITRNINQTGEDASGWSIDSQRGKISSNGSGAAAAEGSGLAGRRVSTNVSPSPKKFGKMGSGTWLNRGTGTAKGAFVSNGLKHVKAGAMVKKEKSNNDSFLHKDYSVKVMAVVPIFLLCISEKMFRKKSLNRKRRRFKQQKQ